MAKDWAKSFYNSAKWKKMRVSILARDKYRCQSPGCFKVAEEVHHLIELNESNIKDENISLNPKNLLSLCADCHQEITRKDKQAAMRKDGKANRLALPDIIFDSDGQPARIEDSPRGL